MKRKIDTNRCWQLELEDKPHTELEVNDTIDLSEHHDGYMKGDRINYVAIPIESVDELILKLLQYKLTYYNKMKVEIEFNNDWNDQ